MCMASLHMTVWTFLDHTPLEIDYALQAYYNRIELENRLKWEIARTQTYFNYLFSPSKRKVTYETFKRQHFKLDFDQEGKETEVIDDEQFDRIMQIMEEKTKGTTGQ